MHLICARLLQSMLVSHEATPPKPGLTAFPREHHHCHPCKAGTLPWLRETSQTHHSTRRGDWRDFSGEWHWGRQVLHTLGLAQQTSRSAHRQPPGLHRRCRCLSHFHCCSHYCCAPCVATTVMTCACKGVIR